VHRVIEEWAHQECEWKHSEGHGAVVLDREGGRQVGLDKMCLLMEVRLQDRALPRPDMRYALSRPNLRCSSA
jgi:hypothetical protein